MNSGKNLVLNTAHASLSNRMFNQQRFSSSYVCYYSIELTVPALFFMPSDSIAAFSEFENCGKANEKYKEIRQIVCGDINHSTSGLARELESIWLLLFLISVFCFPLFACTCQIVKYAQQVQLGPSELHMHEHAPSATNESLKCRLALGGPYAAAEGWSEDACLNVKDSLSECLEISPNRIDIVSVECNQHMLQVSHSRPIDRPIDPLCSLSWI